MLFQSIVSDEMQIYLFSFIRIEKTVKIFHETHCDGDMDFKEFYSFCDIAWRKEHGFVVINMWDKDYCGRYWSNYTEVYILSKYS